VERSRLLSVRVLELMGVAVVGAALALGGADLLGKLGSKTTIQQISPVAQTGGFKNATLQPPTQGMTAEQIYRRDAPGVVQVTATSVSKVIGPLGPTAQTDESLGSGFIIDKAGHIVTNYHVVRGAKKVLVSFSGQDEFHAKVVGTDSATDIAVLKIDTPARALTPLVLGDSDDVDVGDTVYAIGNPFGFTRTLTAGVVSALQRQIDAPNTLAPKIDHVIQTDAAINHGNSGGPLIDVYGRVIGVTSQISTGNTGQQGNLGIGFAIPINMVRDVAAQIIKTGKAEHAYLGVGTAQVTPQLAHLFRLPVAGGLMIQSVERGSGASKARLEPGKTTVVVDGVSYLLGGDIIVAFDGKKITTYEQLRDAVAARRPGDHVKLEIYRGRSKKTISVTLGEQP
jgi:putative serine protease PepD